MLWLTILCVSTFIISSFATLEINVKQLNGNTLPPAGDAACMARYVVHYSNWCTLSYIARKNASIFGTPLGRIYSISDGIPGQSTGVIFFYGFTSRSNCTRFADMTNERTAAFVIYDMLPVYMSLIKAYNNTNSVTNNCSVIVSLAESAYCSTQQWDPQDPRCTQVILNGNIVTVPPASSEFEYVKNSLWTRHPIMHSWYINVPGHKWFFAKLLINHIEVVDTFGGRKFPSLRDYFYKKCGPYLNNSKDIAHFQTDMINVSVENKI